MLLLDQGLPRSTGRLLTQSGLDSVHVGDIGLAAADDAKILQHAREQGRTVVTLDADFHTRLTGVPRLCPEALMGRNGTLGQENEAKILSNLRNISGLQNVSH